ncbi:hypothetical protein HT118_08135 [Escherichia coli]|nr:hypothetical protein [Escherichia coli]
MKPPERRLSSRVNRTKNAQQQSDTEASRLKYTEEAQKAYERLQTPLEKYTARQEELNKALKDGKNSAGRLQHADGGGEKGL